MSNDSIIETIQATDDTAFLGEVVQAALARRKEVNIELKARRAELDAERASLRLRVRKSTTAEAVETSDAAPKKKKKKKSK